MHLHWNGHDLCGNEGLRRGGKGRELFSPLDVVDFYRLRFGNFGTIGDV